MGRAPKYGATHKQERKQWASAMQRNGGWNCSERVCYEPQRWIPWGAPWDLAHAPQDAGYLGPSHPRCNRIEGARRQARTARTPRQWQL